MKRLRVEMKEISEEQKEIKVEQKKVREKFEAIEFECEELRKETILITQQTANTQIRLALMFQILKARQNQELDKATILTHALREREPTKEALTAEDLVATLWSSSY
ncbi:hypothetical protein CXB51_000735 [Gossypium anomalum]|uniref:Uncharacterized protein n=1 Tax=Gossypium anomalum TaxID=47600 RepID=A0A8J6DER0_9ROSI|nr:hypothetical protein CXB51_000735 [Gossypium anomalum]